MEVPSTSQPNSTNSASLAFDLTNPANVSNPTPPTLCNSYLLHPDPATVSDSSLLHPMSSAAVPNLTSPTLANLLEEEIFGLFPKKRKRERSGEMLTAAEAKAKWQLTETDLKRLESTKVGRSRKFYKEDVEDAALRKHGSLQALERQRQEAKESSRIIGSMSIEQHRRKLGDSVKANISVEKYAVAAECHCVTTCLMEVFTDLVIPNSVAVVPKEFTKETPVVVATVKQEGAEKIFGKTKITGGNKYETWHGKKFDLIYLPPSEELRIWWIMS